MTEDVERISDEALEYIRLKTTETVWDRVLKRLAFVGAVLSVALAILGITSWQDIQNTIAAAEENALREVDAAAEQAIEERMAQIESIYSEITLRMTDDLIQSVRSATEAEVEMVTLISRIEDSTRRIEDLEKTVQERYQSAISVFENTEEDWRKGLQVRFQTFSTRALREVAPQMVPDFQLRFEAFEEVGLLGFDDAQDTFVVNTDRADTYGLAQYAAYSAVFHLGIVSRCAGTDPWVSATTRADFDRMRIGLTLYLMARDLDMEAVSFYRSEKPVYFYFHGLRSAAEDASPTPRELQAFLKRVTDGYECGFQEDQNIALVANAMSGALNVPEAGIASSIAAAKANR